MRLFWDFSPAGEAGLGWRPLVRAAGAAAAVAGSLYLLHKYRERRRALGTAARSTEELAETSAVLAALDPVDTNSLCAPCDKDIIRLHSAAPEAGDASPAECYPVPALYKYCTIKRISSFPFKLMSLRQAFSIILSNPQARSTLTAAGRTVLGDLATLYNRNLSAFQQMYDQLVAVSENVAHHEAISLELAQIGMQFSFLDVLFELVVLGVVGGARARVSPSPGGFLELLMAVLYSFPADSPAKRPKAEQYLLLLQNQMMLLIDEIFAGEVYSYLVPESLATAVWECLQRHIQQLTERLQAI